MADAFPMVASCATRQGVYSVNACACGELKSVGMWQCATCAVREELRYRESLERRRERRRA